MARIQKGVYAYPVDASWADPESNWTNEANAIDGSYSTYATCALSGSSNYLALTQDATPMFGDEIVAIFTRLRSATADPANIVTWYYEDNLGQFSSQGNTSNDWSSTRLLSPTGISEWTWPMLRDLEFRPYGQFAGDDVSAVDLVVVTSEAGSSVGEWGDGGWQGSDYMTGHSEVVEDGNGNLYAPSPKGMFKHTNGGLGGVWAEQDGANTPAYDSYSRLASVYVSADEEIVVIDCIGDNGSAGSLRGDARIHVFGTSAHATAADEWISTTTIFDGTAGELVRTHFAPFLGLRANGDLIACFPYTSDGVDSQWGSSINTGSGWSTAAVISPMAGLSCAWATFVLLPNGEVIGAHSGSTNRLRLNTSNVWSAITDTGSAWYYGAGGSPGYVTSGGEDRGYLYAPIGTAVIDALRWNETAFATSVVSDYQAWNDFNDIPTCAMLTDEANDTIYLAYGGSQAYGRNFMGTKIVKSVDDAAWVEEDAFGFDSAGGIGAFGVAMMHMTTNADGDLVLGIINNEAVYIQHVLSAGVALESEVYPVDDVYPAGWDTAPTASQDLYAQVDETTASDTDYIYATDPSP